MKKYLVLYYSKTGNSKFVAKKISQELSCDIKEIIPVFNGLLPLFLISLLKINIPVNISLKDLSGYDEIVIVGPIWGGLLVSPLRSVIAKCVKSSKNFDIAVTCEIPEEKKEGSFGFLRVLKEAGDIGGGLIKTRAAFSTALIKMGEEWRPKLSEKIKITEDNFNEGIRSRFDEFLAKIKVS